MHSLWQDVRFAVRQLAHNRTSSLVALLTLALGIGANTSVLGLENALLFKPAQARDPHRLVWLASHRANSSRMSSWSYPAYARIRDQAKSYQGVVAFTGVELSMGGASPERVRGIVASGNYFDVLGVPVAAGRVFSPEDDGAPGAHPVAVLSHAFWTRRFGADSGVIGRTITLNGKPYTVAGVIGRGFNGAEVGELNDLWIPIAQMSALSTFGSQPLAGEYNNLFRVIGRLKSGATIEGARQEANALGALMTAPDARSEDQRSLAVLPVAGGLDPSNRQQIAPVLGLVMIVPLLVLLVACANVANLFLGRALGRRKELAVRRAIGASRGRLVRLLVTESVVLALGAAVAGVVLSSWMTAIIANIAKVPADIVPALTSADPRVFAATAGLAVLAGMLFGVVPALVSTGGALSPALKNEGITVGRSRHRLRNAFVVAQASASLVLLITAGLLVRSLDKALRVAPGFDPDRSVAFSFDLVAQGYSEERRGVFVRTALDRTRQLPGVADAAIATMLPLSGRMSATEIVREGVTDPRDRITVRNSAVSDGYFSTMKIPLVAGRAFAATDTKTSAPVAIVNETLAHALWPDGSALGRRIRMTGSDAPLREIVGIARDGKYENLVEGPTPFYYEPVAQGDAGGDEVVLIVRSASGDGRATVAPVTSLFRSLDPNLPLFKVSTLQENLARTVDAQRAGAVLLAVFGVLALGLAALGIYGVVAHGVTLRTREIGIRMSLGAQAGTVLAGFVREGLRLTFIGIAIGVTASAALSGVLAKFMFGLAPTDVLTFLLGAGVLTGAAFLASVFPARRAARVDPMVALRAE
ncbi:MAG TPA: ABC transporter permease [Gemmatimonadaceae bacterium]|nr:ABC transporter permease [Gemmatimonadaceae bacterium]